MSNQVLKVSKVIRELLYKSQNEVNIEKTIMGFLVCKCMECEEDHFDTKNIGTEEEPDIRCEECIPRCSQCENITEYICENCGNDLCENCKDEKVVFCEKCESGFCDCCHHLIQCDFCEENCCCECENGSVIFCESCDLVCCNECDIFVFNEEEETWFCPNCNTHNRNYEDDDE